MENKHMKKMIHNTCFGEMQILSNKLIITSRLGFPGGSVVKNLPANAEDAGLTPGSRRSPGRKWQPTPVFLPGKTHGQRSLAGYSPWGHRVKHN